MPRTPDYVKYRQIMDYLEDNPKATQRQIQTACKTSPNTIQKAKEWQKNREEPINDIDINNNINNISDINIIKTPQDFSQEEEAEIEAELDIDINNNINNADKKDTFLKELQQITKEEIISVLIQKGESSIAPEYKRIANRLASFGGHNTGYQRRFITDTLDMIIDFFYISKK